ncbi:hypothetical protein PAL_GLEAN10025408 [Pteropus alecto]|uniref:Uncharacterized protein n=1 Tax=Pteropus alecto TaxID=9402 RepID=L5JMX4_PTEAL|nr:hypothetical protein PAL_GLEAN10025408 [Pteropus alecto]
MLPSQAGAAAALGRGSALGGTLNRTPTGEKQGSNMKEAQKRNSVYSLAEHRSEVSANNILNELLSYNLPPRRPPRGPSTAAARATRSRARRRSWARSGAA